MQIKWKSGNKSWLDAKHIKHTAAMRQYLTAQGVEDIHMLPRGIAKSPDDPQLFSGMVLLIYDSDFARRNSITNPLTIFNYGFGAFNPQSPAARAVNPSMHLNVCIMWMSYNLDQQFYHLITSPG
jgi:hypothetical protein